MNQERTGNENEEAVRAVAEMDAAISTITRNWHGLRTIDGTWNVRGALQNMDRLRLSMDEVSLVWSDAEARLGERIADIRAMLATAAYAEELEREMKEAGIPFSGEFPQYILPPFKLQISVDQLEARLSLGRKNERTADLQPAVLAKWTALRYRKVITRKFNATAFMKDLLEAYRISARLNFREKEAPYGRAVPIMELYDILTLRQGSRQEYPSQFFTFDLGLLKESGLMRMDRYHFELGFARDQKRAIVVVDSRGREDRISSLTVHLSEGGL